MPFNGGTKIWNEIYLCTTLPSGHSLSKTTTTSKTTNTREHSKGLKLGHLLNCTNTPWSSRPLQNYLLDKL